MRYMIRSKKISECLNFWKSSKTTRYQFSRRPKDWIGRNGFLKGIFRNIVVAAVLARLIGAAGISCRHLYRGFRRTASAFSRNRKDALLRWRGIRTERPADTADKQGIENSR